MPESCACATVLGLVPLAMHGGPLWEPLCCAQIGGLTIATFITLLLVPVMYSIFVLDLKLIRWDVRAPEIPTGDRDGKISEGDRAKQKQGTN